LLECVEADENFIKNIVNGDETWVCGYDPKNKQQLSQPNNAHQDWCKTKVMIIASCLIKKVFYSMNTLHKVKL
jgi:hypothetical protein